MLLRATFWPNHSFFMLKVYICSCMAPSVVLAPSVVSVGGLFMYGSVGGRWVHVWLRRWVERIMLIFGRGFFVSLLGVWRYLECMRLGCALFLSVGLRRDMKKNYTTENFRKELGRLYFKSGKLNCYVQNINLVDKTRVIHELREISAQAECLLKQISTI